MNRFRSESSYRWFVLGIVMMGTFMAILDSSIVNVALPHMMSTFGVNRDQIEWVATAFMLATAVIMPLVGWILGRVGHKALYLSALAVFTLGSAACAFAWSYDLLITARVFQAIGGGAIQPVGMAIVADLFEPHERGKALGIWGTGIMFGPATGPTLGGLLTDWFNWRMIFLVNLPFGVLALIIGMALMKSEKERERRPVPFDTWGFIFLSMALISGLLALAKGEEKGWDSNYIYICLALTIVGLVMFLAIESAIRDPLLDLKLFRLRNFTISMVLAVFRAVGLFGGVFLLPIFLESLIGYTTTQTGLWMMPGALAVGVTMPIAGMLADRYNPRWQTALGIALASFSLFLYSELDPLSSATMIIGPQLIRGVGLAFMMAPLITVAINSVPKDRVAMASGFLNVAQQVGGSFGIAFLNNYVTSSIHLHAVRIGELLGIGSQAFQRLSLRTAGMEFKGIHGVLFTDQFKAQAVTIKTIMHRASVMGFDNGFVIGGWIVLVGLPICLLLQQQKHLQKTNGLAAGAD